MKRYKKNSLLFRILIIVNPIVALLGTLSLANQLHIGWFLLMFYNVSNIYVYLIKRKDFWLYALVSGLHFTFGLLALYKIYN